MLDTLELLVFFFVTVLRVVFVFFFGALELVVASLSSESTAFLFFGVVTAVILSMSVTGRICMEFKMV
jgi:hypothetical protein